jgi:ABC-type Fe3+/spermidine/putrescine transport system ATPase subunit
MFQDYALFPHQDVFENVAFGLKMQGADRAEIERDVRAALARVGLAGYERRDVNVLSGGEQQRVALARALAPRPRLLMLDEPLGSLDRALRETLLGELRNVLRGQTALIVTHDQAEAFALAHHVAVMSAGRIVQEGTPRGIYARPRTPFIAEFLGAANLLAGHVAEQVGSGVARIAIEGSGACLAFETAAPAGAAVDLVLRPEHLVVSASKPAEQANVLAGCIGKIAFLGSVVECVVDVEGGPQLRALAAPDLDLAEGMQVWLRAAAATVIER